MINADDAGIDEHVDACILKAAREGLLSSASVIVNGKTAPTFVPSAKTLGIGLGLHFNITEGLPTSGEASSLTSGDGQFCGPKDEVWQNACQGFLDPLALRAEIKAQWQTLLRLGAEPSHIDSHNHVHLYPCVLSAILDVLPRAKPLHIRIPFETSCPKDKRPPFPNPHLTKKEMRRRIEDAGHFACQEFVGFQFSVTQEEESISALATTSTTSCEWMVHPGRRKKSTFTASKDRQCELDFLTADSLKNLIESWNLDVVPFGELS